jgi:CubicO group peptidase (beta-lactamase class C family)
MEATALVREDGSMVASGVTARVPWWSFTKTVLAIAALRLAEQGKMDLDTSVNGKPYTPAQLLGHQGGLPDYGDLPTYHAAVAARQLPWPIERLWAAADADRLRYEPGRGWGYSNIGYHLVARLIETATNRSLGDALSDLVFEPSNLATARLANTPEDLADVCMGDVTGYHPGWVYHGLVVGTVADAALFLHRLLAGELLGAAMLKRMQDAMPLPQFRSKLHPDPAYGLGLMVLAATSPHPHAGHAGGGPGSRIAVYGRRGTTCALWAATTSTMDPEADAFRILGSIA